MVDEIPALAEGGETSIHRVAYSWSIIVNRLLCRWRTAKSKN